MNNNKIRIKLLPVFIAALTAVTMITASARDAEIENNAVENNYVAVYEETADETEAPNVTEKPTEAPTKKPTEKPTERPTERPTQKPTDLKPQPTQPQNPNKPQTPNVPDATQPTTKKQGALGGIQIPDLGKENETTTGKMTTATDVSGNILTSPDGTFISYTAPDLSESDTQASARRKKQILQVSAAAGIGITAAAILVIKLLHDRAKAMDVED